jgi:hypothetical protein
MGMDVYGVNPQTTTEQPTEPKSSDFGSDEWSAYFEARRKWEQENPGTYFRNNVWYWRPLWDYVYSLCDDILTEDDHQSGHHNDGHLIDADKCEAIASRLALELLNGGVTKFKDDRQEYLDNLPLKKCDTGSCNGTGQRDDKYLKGECNGCGGTGEQKDHETHYPFDEDNVREFHSFVKNCGGFEIN